MIRQVLLNGGIYLIYFKKNLAVRDDHTDFL